MTFGTGVRVPELPRGDKSAACLSDFGIRRLPVKSRLPLLLSCLVATGLFELFLHYDWDEGVVRAVVVIALLALLLGVRAAGFKGEVWPRWLLIAASIAVGGLLYWHFKEGILSTVRQRRSEMGDIHVRAVKLLAKGVTPWHLGTVLESNWLKYTIFDPSVVACRTVSVTPDERAQSELWESERSGAEFLPERINEPGCEGARSIVSQMGYRYGPAMVASYVPLVLLLGRGGEYVTHLFFLVAILGAMAVLLRERAREALVMACVVLLGQSVLRFDTLYHSDCDLIPTARMLWALVAFEQGRSFTAGALTGLTLAAKIFPAAFLLPLLIGSGVKRSHALAGFLVVSALAWAPAFAIDGMGVWDNVVRFNLDRPADSTALAFFAPGWVMWMVRVAVVALCAFAFWRFVLGPGQLEPMLFVAISIGSFLLITKVFHNNYVVWWLPVVGVVLARSTSAARPAPHPS